MLNHVVPPQTTGTVAPQSTEILPLKGPSQADWERHRPLIKQLYVDERMKLKEIIPIMLQYGHKASPRTYKNWIHRWGLDKKNKESDMVAIVRKKTQRDAAGKRSLFRVRGQIITTEQVEYYFKRKKKATDFAMANAPTPSDVSCWTPPPPGTPKPLEEGEEHDPTLATNNSLTQGLQRFPEFPSDNNFMEARLVAGANFHLPQLRIDNEIVQLAVQDVCNILSESPRVCHSPLPPQELTVPERLFFNIKAHIDGSFESGIWALDTNGWLKNTKSFVKIYKNLEEKFWNYCLSALLLIDECAFIEARRALSKMFNLVYNLILSTRPWTLYAFLRVFLILKSAGHQEVLRELQRYIFAMARKVIINNSPWGYICQILSTCDERVLEQIIIESWKCSTDRIMNFIGLFNQGFLHIYLDCIDTVYRENLPEAERLIRKVLDQSVTIVDATYTQTLQIKCALGSNLIRQGRHAEAEIMLLDALSNAQQTGSFWDGIRLKVSLAWCQFWQNKRGFAEANMRDAIRLASKRVEISDPCIAANILVLQNWLKTWGRCEEATELKAESDAIIGPDEVDQEMPWMNNQEI